MKTSRERGKNNSREKSRNGGKKEKEERRRLEREEKERLEREKENIRLKEQMLEKKKQREEEKEREKSEFEKKVPLPVSSPKKVGKSVEAQKSHRSPDTVPVKNPESSSHMSEVKTPKKLRKWPAENESPDPKKNFIKKHQEEQEKLHQVTVQNSSPSLTTAPAPTPPAPAPAPAQ